MKFKQTGIETNTNQTITKFRAIYAQFSNMKQKIKDINTDNIVELANRN